MASLEAEWRNFADDDRDRSRVGGPVMSELLANPLATSLSGGGSLSRYHRSASENYGDKRFAQVLRSLEEIADGLPRVGAVKLPAAELYLRCMQNQGHGLRGRTCVAVEAAALVCVVQSQHLPISLVEVANAYSLPPKTVYRQLKVSAPAARRLCRPSTAPLVPVCAECGCCRRLPCCAATSGG